MRKEKKKCEPGRCRARILQGACWGGLLLVQVFMLHCLDTRAETAAFAQTGESMQSGRMVQTEELSGQLEVHSEWYGSEAECPVPPERYESEDDGRIYERKSWTTRREVLPERLKTVEQEQLFERVEGMTPIPETAEFEVTDEGRTGKTRARAESVTVLREVWSTDFAFPLTFHSCDAEYCQLGDRMIPYREEKPEFEGQEHLLLDVIDAPQDQYRITDVRWDGEIYLDEAGIPCRNAVASGEKLLRDYRVLYRGTARFPAAERWQTVTVYALPQEETVTVLPEDTGSVMEEREMQEEDPLASSDTGIPFWEKLIRTIRVAISLLIPLLILLVVLVKRKRAWYTGQKEGKSHRRRERT